MPKSSEENLSAQLRAFGMALERRAEAPLRPPGPAVSDAQASGSEHRSRPWVLAAAAAIVAVATGALLWVARDAGNSDTLIPVETAATTPTLRNTTPPSTEMSISTTGAAATSAPTSSPSGAASEFGFTPVGLATTPDGYALDYRVESPASFDVGFERHRSTDPSAPALEVIVRNVDDSFMDPLRELDRMTWQVAGSDGRPLTVYDDNQGEGCLIDYCSVGVQWDPNTNVSVTWSARPGTELGAGYSIDDLVELVGRLVEVGTDEYRAAAGFPSPLLSSDGVVTADANGVIAFDRWDPEPLAIYDQPALSAIGLPDGRVLVEVAPDARPDGETVLIVDPFSTDRDGQIFEAPERPDDIKETRVLDAATIDGEPHLLIEEKVGPCDGTGPCTTRVRVGPIGLDSPTTPWRTLIDEPDSLEPRFGLDLLGSPIEAVVGQRDTFTETRPVAISARDGRPVPGLISTLGLQESYPLQPNQPRLSIGADGAYVVTQLDDGPLRIHDLTTGADSFVELDGIVALSPRRLFGIDAGLRRAPDNSPDGTIWLTTLYVDDAVDGSEFIAIDPAGSIVDRRRAAPLGNASLRTANR